jgi:hypothetical protein
MNETTVVGMIATEFSGTFSRKEINRLLNIYWLNNENANFYNKETGKLELIDSPYQDKLGDA